MEEYYNNNYTKIMGRIDSNIEENHDAYREKFYKLFLKVPRLSKTFDLLPVIFSERLIDINILKYEDLVQVEGQYRSYNNIFSNDNKLILITFAKDIKKIDEINYTQNPNQIKLSGFICKKPVYRETPFGREICDILLAVNRKYGKSDYIPCISWGRNAKFVSKLEVGKHITIWGRIQSRSYDKKVNEEITISKTAYEVSISRLELVENE
jgi:primosomal replication protein N